MAEIEVAKGVGRQETAMVGRAEAVGLRTEIDWSGQGGASRNGEENSERLQASDDFTLLG